jgi:hypothetical protein
MYLWSDARPRKWREASVSAHCTSLEDCTRKDTFLVCCYEEWRARSTGTISLAESGPCPGNLLPVDRRDPRRELPNPSLRRTPGAPGGHSQQRATGRSRYLATKNGTTLPIALARASRAGPRHAQGTCGESNMAGSRLQESFCGHPMSAGTKPPWRSVCAVDASSRDGKLYSSDGTHLLWYSESSSSRRKT